MGAYEATRHLDRDQHIIVFTDDTMGVFPGASPGTNQGVTGTRLPGPGASDTLLGLDTLRLDVTPRAGIRMTTKLEQVPGVNIVHLDVTVVNKSVASTFSFADSDFTLRVDGVALRTQVEGSRAKRSYAAPGVTTEITDYYWILPQGPFAETAFSYASTDSQSVGFNKTVRVVESIPISATTTTKPASAEVQGYLDTLESMWRGAGVHVLAVSSSPLDARTEQLIKDNTKETDVLPWVSVEVPAADFGKYEGTFVYDNIMRQTMLAVRGGVPLHYLGVTTVENDGTKREWTSSEVFQLSGLAGPEWDRPASVAISSVEDQVKQMLTDAATKSGVSSPALQVTEDASGRVVTATGLIPDVKHPSVSIMSFGSSIQDVVSQLNKQGAKIAALYIKIDDASSNPAVRLVWSFTIGAGSTSRWLAPEVQAINKG